MIDLLSFRLGLLLPKMPFFQISEQSFLRMASDSDVSSVSDLSTSSEDEQEGDEEPGGSGFVNWVI